MATRIIANQLGDRLYEVAVVSGSDQGRDFAAIHIINIGPAGLIPAEARALADALTSAAREVERMQRQRKRK